MAIKRSNQKEMDKDLSVVLNRNREDMVEDGAVVWEFYSTSTNKNTQSSTDALQLQEKSRLYKEGDILENNCKNDNGIDYITTSNINNKELDLIAENIIKLSDDNKSLVNSLIENIDISDLSFGELPFDDCLCYETSPVQSEDLVDSPLAMEGASITFSNSDSVQFFKDKNALIDKMDEEDVLNFEHFLASNTRSNDSCSKLQNLFYDSSHNYDFYHVFELIGNTMNADNKQDCLIDNKNKADIESEAVRKTKVVCKQRTGHACLPKGRRYLPSFKQKVLEYAANHSFKETASKYSINCNTVTEWSRESKRLLLLNKSTTTLPGSVWNRKTDLSNTPVTKTENILNDEVSLETDCNHTTAIMNVTDSETTGGGDLPEEATQADDKFVLWIVQKRKEQQRLTADMVLRAASACLMAAPEHERPAWFVAYIRRFNKVLRCPARTINETEKYIMYPYKFKLQVALYARVHSKNSAAKVFNVPRRRMFDWYNQVNSQQANVLVDDKTKSKMYSYLTDWYQEERSQGHSPTSSQLRDKCKELFLAHGIKDMKFSEGWLNKFCKRHNIQLRHCDDAELLMWILAQFDNNVSLSHQQITDKSCELVGKRKSCEFKGSKGWTLRFLKRHSCFLQHIPSVGDRLPDIATVKVQVFLEGVYSLVGARAMGPANIASMDEIPISFHYPQDDKGGHLPLLRKTGFENRHAVVILCVLASGKVLPPLILFKGDFCDEVSSDMPVVYRENGMVDDSVLIAWLDHVWLKCMSADSPNILLVDSFKPHHSPLFHQRLANSNTVISIIPEGCASQLQPITVGIAQFFQNCIKEEWQRLSSNPTSFPSRTCSNKCQYPGNETLLSWVRGAYHRIQQNPTSISFSFNRTRILK